jgi:HAD superfamily hydrolase (TIGR01490 family)
MNADDQTRTAAPAVAVEELPPRVGRPLAVFDLDGTLVRGDTFLPFLATFSFRRGRPWLLLLLPFWVLLYVCRLVPAERAKERLLIAFFRGEAPDVIAEHAARFSQTWVKKRLRAPVVEKLRQHQAAGHRVILLSASPDLYVPAVGGLLGIAEVVCTRVAVECNLCRGTIVGDNCKGVAKVSVLKRHLRAPEPPEESYAYGDSASDLPLLRWVKLGFLIKKGRLAPLAGREGLAR